MKFLTFDVQKEPGFRFNLTDLIFLILLGLSSVLIHHFYGTFYSLYLLPLYIGFTFFLFCNVFRVGRSLELIWIVSFLLITVISHYFFEQKWFGMSALTSSLFQAIQVLIHIRTESYKGIFHRKTKHLEDYDPSWIVKASQPYIDEYPWLPAALEKCTRVCNDDPTYIYFVESKHANQPGSAWQFQENITLENTPEGEIILDIIKPNIVGGVEFYEKLD